MSFQFSVLLLQLRRKRNLLQMPTIFGFPPLSKYWLTQPNAFWWKQTAWKKLGWMHAREPGLAAAWRQLGGRALPGSEECAGSPAQPALCYTPAQVSLRPFSLIISALCVKMARIVSCVWWQGEQPCEGRCHVVTGCHPCVRVSPCRSRSPGHPTSSVITAGEKINWETRCEALWEPMNDGGLSPALLMLRMHVWRVCN